MKKEPAWVLEARVKRTKLKGEIFSSEGFFGRFLHVANGIDLAKLIKTKVGKKRLNLLNVGPSSRTELWGYACYETYELVAYLEGHGFSYDRLDILDRRAEALDHFKKHKKDMVVSCWDFRNEKVFYEQWGVYKELIQDETMTTKPYGEHYNGKIPESIEKKLESGKICLRPGDITTTDLPWGGQKYDWVVCRNVLWQLREDGQKLALRNMAEAMEEKGLLLVGPGAELSQKHTVPDIGPWFNRCWQRKIGLRFAKDSETNGCGEMVLYKV